MMQRRLALLLLSLVSCTACAQDRTRDVIYLHEGGAAFTFDVFRPARPNRAAVIWLVSGGWFSKHEDINPDLAKYFTDSGFTVFEVVHGSQPRYKIPEIVSQVRRAVRVIHAHADDYGIDANRIGVSGASAGGHLTLMIAGLGDDGNSKSPDSVERASSRVDAAVAIMPPTDFQNWGAPGRMPMDAPQMAVFIPAFGIAPGATPSDRQKIAKDLSPIQYVNPSYPPTLLVHGDADTLVPVQQSRSMDEAMTKAKIDHELMVVPGGGHDGKTFTPALTKILDWFKAKLLR